MTSDADDPDYKVGYGNPPKGPQYKPGQSGNPSGRPKKVASYDDIVREVGNLPVVVNSERGPETITGAKAVVIRRMQNALQGKIGHANKFTDDYKKSTQGLDITDEVIAADREAASHILQTYFEAAQRRAAEDAAKGERP